jgi:predicted transcriptional regulator
MGLEKDSLKIYELFKDSYPKYGDYQGYFAIHTLDRLYLDLDNKKESKEIKKIVKPFLSEYTVHPYLMLKDLDDEKESEIIKLIFKDINTNVFPNKNFTKEVIQKVEYPSLDVDFMKNLLSKITSEKDERFREYAKARKLFLLYADKQHLEMTLNELRSYANLYHRANDSGGGLDCGDY